jgi:hypothetical protein
MIELAEVPYRADISAAALKLRAAKLLGLIESATGKLVTGRDSDETAQAFGGPL